MIVSNLADVSRSCSLSCQRNNVLQHHVVKESHLITSLNDTCEPKITPQQEVVRKRFHYLQKYFSELPMIVSSGDNFFSWRSIHCEPISIRDTIKLRTSSTINSSAYKFDHRIPNFAQSNQLNDSHIANKKDRQFDYCDDDDANDGDDDDDDDDHDDHNDDDGEAGEPRRAVASWLVGSRRAAQGRRRRETRDRRCIVHIVHIL